jgi:hypothetical protein
MPPNETVEKAFRTGRSKGKLESFLGQVGKGKSSLEGRHGVLAACPRSQVALGNASFLAVALPQLSPRVAPQQRCHAWTPLMASRATPFQLWLSSGTLRRHSTTPNLPLAERIERSDVRWRENVSWRDDSATNHSNPHGRMSGKVAGGPRENRSSNIPRSLPRWERCRR